MIQPDWHSADIIAALKSRGVAVRRFRKSGLASSTLANALNRHWPKGKADCRRVGVAPEHIWPSRYRKPEYC